MKITIVDVAKKANVSVATVSRVINDNYPVNSKTKAKVQKVIKELNFIPNLQAREVKKRKTKTIGVIVPSVENMFFPEVINGIEQHLMQKSYSLLLSFSKNSEEKEQECVRNL
ncbi:MAG: LacI family DNA-binding transcriptional regulator, partial [Longicatena sp.]